MLRQSWPELAREINYHEPWELRYWATRFRIPVEQLSQLAERLLGDLKAIRAELDKPNSTS